MKFGRKGAKLEIVNLTETVWRCLGVERSVSEKLKNAALAFKKPKEHLTVKPRSGTPVNLV